MENSIDRASDINAWAQREHEIKLHNKIQAWGEMILPLLHDTTVDDTQDRQELFQLLMNSVENGNHDLARMIDRHEVEMLESTRSWYTGNVGHLGADQRQAMIQNRFLSLLKVYKAGKAAG